jgi:hypothetical protein
MVDCLRPPALNSTSRSRSRSSPRNAILALFVDRICFEKENMDPNAFSHSQTLSHKHTHTLTHTHKHTHTLTNTHTLTLSHKHTHSHSLINTHTLSQTNTHNLSQTNKQTNTHTNKHTHTHRPSASGPRTVRHLSFNIFPSSFPAKKKLRPQKLTLTPRSIATR